MAQSVKHLTLGFSLAHGLTFHGFGPRIWLCADSAEPAWDSLSPSHLLMHLCSLSQNKQTYKKRIYRLTDLEQ